MKREDAFNDIFTNPISGEEYNIFSDNSFGKRLDWEVGKSEDGKETVRPVNVSFRDIDLSKLDSVDLPEGVSAAEVKGFSVAQITAGKIDFENTGHNGYEWDKSDFYILSPDLKCVAVIKDNTFGMEEGMSIKDVIPFSKNSENKINDMINDNKNAIADLLDRSGIDAGSKNVGKVIFDVSGTLEAKIGDVIRLEKGESNADIADKYVNDVLDMKLDCIEAVHQADMVIASYAKEKIDGNGETADDSFKAVSEAVLLKQGALSELPELNDLIIDLGINNELKDELDKNKFIEIEKKYTEIKEDMSGISVLSKSDGFKDKLTAIIDNSNSKATEKIQVESREGKIDVLRNETGIRYINPEGNTIEISRDTKNIANHYMEILSAAHCTDEKKEDLFASSALMIGESDGTMQGDINNLYEVKEYILNHYEDAFNEFDSFISVSENGVAIESSEVRNVELEVSQIIRDGVADRLEEDTDKVDNDIDKMEVATTTDAKPDVESVNDKEKQEAAVANNTIESYKEHFEETTEKLDATILKYGNVSRRFVSTKAMELSRMIDAKRLGYGMNEIGMTQKLYGGYTREERVLMDRKIYAADIVFTAMDMLHANILDEAAYRIVGNILIGIENFICKDRDSVIENDSVDKESNDNKIDNKKDDVEIEQEAIEQPDYDAIPEGTEYFDIDPTEHDSVIQSDVSDNDKVDLDNQDNTESDKIDEVSQDDKDNVGKQENEENATKDEKNNTDTDTDKIENITKDDSKDDEDNFKVLESDNEKFDNDIKDAEIEKTDKIDENTLEKDIVQRQEDINDNIEQKADNNTEISNIEESAEPDLEVDTFEKDIVDNENLDFETSEIKVDSKNSDKDVEKDDKDSVVDAAADEESDQIEKEQEQDKISEEKIDEESNAEKVDNEQEIEGKESQEDSVSEGKDKDNPQEENLIELNNGIDNEDDDIEEKNDTSADSIQDKLETEVKKLAADEESEESSKKKDDATDNAFNEVENGLNNIENYGNEIDTIKDVISSNSADHEDIARALEDVPAELQSDAVKAAFDDAVASGNEADTLLDSLSIITDEISINDTNGLDPFELNDYKGQLDESLISRGDADAVNSWNYDIEPEQRGSSDINDASVNDISYDSEALMYYTDPVQFEQDFINDISNDINEIIDNTFKDAVDNDNLNDVSNDSDLIEKQPDDILNDADDTMMNDFEKNQVDIEIQEQDDSLNPGDIDTEDLADAIE